jgi:hypothetical protein
VRPFDETVALSDGTNITYGQRQRPHLVLHNDGVPGVAPSGSPRALVTGLKLFNNDPNGQLPWMKRCGGAMEPGCDKTITHLQRIKTDDGGGNGKMNGIQLLNGQWGQAKYDSAEAAATLDSLIKQTNASWISMTFCWYQASVDTPGPIVARNGTSPTDAALLQMTAAAKQRGLKVLWRPCVDPHPMTDPEGQHVWRGDIGRSFSETQWGIWFGSYTPFINHYASLAQKGEVDQFSVGMELIQVGHREQQMRQLVASVRGLFKGLLTYGANHGEEQSVKFWDALDVIGVDAVRALLPCCMAVPNIYQ